MPNHNMISKEEVSNYGWFGERYTITFETTEFREYMKVKDLCNELIKERDLCNELTNKREEDSNVNNK